MNGAYEDFLAALLAFESGWDRERFDSGDIQDWQLNQWSGGTVDDFYPQYSSWSQLSDDEWSMMAYRSTNTFGFVGYQFGEALLIDLGYYDDSFYYGNGASTNTWDGTWTGKNGANSLEDFKTAEVQDVAIQDAFGHNLSIIEELLGASGESLDDYLGTTITYVQNGVQGSVELTLTGILAGAHLRGAPAVVELLQNGSISVDEYGTSILQYIDQFGGFEAPAINELITNFEDGKTGDEGLGAPGEIVAGGGSENGSADVTAGDADVVLDWNWGQNEVITNFDTDTDTIFIGWFTAEHIGVSEINGNVVFTIASNNQSITLEGVTLSGLDGENFTILDSSAATKILALVGSADDDDIVVDDNDDGVVVDDNNDDDDVIIDDNDDDVVVVDNSGSSSSNGTANVTKATATVVITWAWGNDTTITDFDPSSDTIFVDWFNLGQIVISEVGDQLIFSIPDNNQTITLDGVSFSDLSESNFTIMQEATASEILGIVGETDSGSSEGEMDGDHDMSSGEAVMHMITLNSASKVISDFDVAKDMFHIEGGITGALLDIRDVASGSETNLVITVFDLDGNVVSTTVAENVSLSDLSLGNFSIAEQTALNEVASLLGQNISTPSDDGEFGISYDSDGSNPPPTTGTTDSGGVKYKADFNADDITNFNVAIDQLDFGDTTVHGMIVTKSLQDELIIDNPWWGEMQILQGVQIADMTIDNFGVVGNEHFRQDIGGVVSWELGAGPRESNTVYIRSHEYGIHEVVDNFDPSAMKISFLYYGTRERLSVEDTDEGLVVSTQPSGQSMTFTGITLADLQPGTLEFHHDQVIEDNLEVPFGFNQNDVALVSRNELLTPEAPEGVTTDGYQTRDGVLSVSEANDDPAEDTEDYSNEVAVNDDGSEDASNDNNGTDTGGENPGNGIADVHHITWNWSAVEVISGFDASEDILDFGSLSAKQLSISEVNDALMIEVLDNGGHTYVIENTQAENLTADNFIAAGWNYGVLEDEDGVFDQLISLGSQDFS
ncbi:MAG: hypothetical protein COB93_02835 [Sneathiella sp.]|nr:MAG: hypothetical protein COB93_02835 [Sneathiella sp.]